MKRLAIIGNPVGHSFSPAMHNYISKKLGLDYHYEAILSTKSEFKELLKSLPDNNFTGVNITAPFKFDAFEIADVISDKARKFGSVNTCVFKDDRIYAYNTDADGLYASLLTHGVNIKDKHILFLGAGGAAKPSVTYFSELSPKSITIHNRSHEKAVMIADYVKNLNGFEIETEISKEHYDVVINTTSVGMHPDIMNSPVSEIPYIDDNTFVYDMIYNPEKTLFLQKAEQKGAKIANGLGMLIYQGIYAYELFTGVKLDASIYYDILRDVFGK